MVILILLSVASGFTVFRLFKYEAAILVIQTKTLEKGEREISVEGVDPGYRSRLSFELGSDQGNTCIYTLVLPRTRLKTIRIPPLASPGKYEIDEITLSNSAFSYSWNEKLECSQKMFRQGVMQREACSGMSPLIAVDSDSSLIISALPDSGFETDTRYRIALAVLSALGVFMCGTWLLKPVRQFHREQQVRYYFARFSWVVIASLFVLQLYVLLTYAVDIPNYEEWEFFEPFALPNGLSWQWLNRPVSHQRMMLFTKLMAWVNFKLFALDFVILKLFNYAVFGCLLYALVRFKERVLGRQSFSLFPLFLMFLISPIVFEVHAASFQSGELFVLLFSVFMLIYAYRDGESYGGTAVFYLCALLAMCSLSAGVVMVIFILAGKTVYSAAGIMRRRIPRDGELRHLAISWGLILPTLMLLLYDFKKPEHNPDWLFPNTVKFWESFLSLLSFGFGIESEHPLPGIVCLVIVTLPIILLLTKKTTRWQPATWQVLTATLTILAVIGLITIGRGNMVGSIKVSRYVIFSILLIPLASMSWWLAMNSFAERRVALGLLWAFCMATFWNNWDYNVYRDMRHQDILNLDCVENYSRGKGDGVCEGTHFRPIGKYFDNAKNLDVRFTRQFKASIPEKSAP